MTVKEFPFDLLHVCSHGGEVPGVEIELEFTDRDEIKHKIVYEEVSGFAPSRNEELIEVVLMYHFRNFDGLKWKSKELKAKHYERYVFADMMTAIKSNKLHKGRKVDKVSGSRSIKCSDFIYQANFQIIAGYHSNPIIFNNTCWSGGEIGLEFVHGGARGYIGTFWDVDNDDAIEFADTFYSSLFKGTLLDAYFLASQSIKNNVSDNIYIFYGLHFSTLTTGRSISESRIAISRAMMNAFYRWYDYLPYSRNKHIKENINRLMNWIVSQLRTKFVSETMLFFRRIKK
ncbi:MAG: hypothetical protein EOO07_01015 [Chitinophagaceae bacterium]|nr:MAG: hypothetical protein EOO07_01015 [Chitinophagaceae bacterium]